MFYFCICYLNIQKHLKIKPSDPVTMLRHQEGSKWVWNVISELG